MDILKKPLATLGIGAAKVDARLEKSTFLQGEQVRGQVVIQGGSIEQHIDEVYLYLIIQYEYEGSQREYVIRNFQITEPFTIGSKEEQRLSFEFQLPFDAPISIAGAPIYLKTGLDIKMARNPQDMDGVEILPHPYVDMILEAVEHIGFKYSTIKFDFEHHYSRNPFVQVFLFTPVGEMVKQLEEISLIITASEQDIDIIMQTDRQGSDLLSSMEEAFELDRRLSHFTINSTEIQGGQEVLAKRIIQELEEQHQLK